MRAHVTVEAVLALEASAAQLASELTYKRLFIACSMLLPHVVSQRLCVPRHHPTDFTFEWTLVHVDAPMSLQMPALGERRRTHGACKRSFTGVQHHVALEVEVADECCTADLAGEGTLACVLTAVDLQIARLVERSATLITFVRPFSHRVDLHVALEVAKLNGITTDLAPGAVAEDRLSVSVFRQPLTSVDKDVHLEVAVSAERSGTNIALEWSFPCVPSHVALEISFESKCHATHFTLEWTHACVSSHVIF